MSVERMWVAFYVHNGQEQQRAAANQSHQQDHLPFPEALNDLSCQSVSSNKTGQQLKEIWG